jgi:hypothetical protein
MHAQQVNAFPTQSYFEECMIRKLAPAYVAFRPAQSPAGRLQMGLFGLSGRARAAAGRKRKILGCGRLGKHAVRVGAGVF